jgi:glycosyltransferase involved in cell wall biosynthesis
MTVFRRHELAARALFSVVEQDYREWELRIVTDGPHPRVAAMIRNFRDREPLLAPRINYLTGVAAPGCWGNRARRIGLETALGGYTVFLSHDCILLPGYLAAHAATIGRHDPCVSLVDIRCWRDKTVDTAGNTKYLERLFYCGVWPPKDKDVTALGPRDGFDLTCMAMPTEPARVLGVFGPDMEREYGADYLSYKLCREHMPVVHRPGVVGAHF